MSPLLSLRDVSMRFGGVRALNNVRFDVQAGEVFTLMGPNGAGKTTVFNLISRICTPSAGSITYYSPQGPLQLTAQPPHHIASLGIARTFQDIALFEQASVLQNLLVGRHTHRKSAFWQDLFFGTKVRAAERLALDKAEEVMGFLGLQHCRDCLATTLPHGVRKTVELARALCTEPRMLLLDEPFSGLNAQESLDMASWIQAIRRQWGITVLMAEHNGALASKVSDRVLVMNEGEILAIGTPRDVQNDSRVIEAHQGSLDDVSTLRRKGREVHGTAQPRVPEL